MLDAATPLILNPADNVAILTARAPGAPVRSASARRSPRPVAAGHKIARADIAAGRRRREVRPGDRLRDRRRSPPASMCIPTTARSAPTTRTTGSAPTSRPRAAAIPAVGAARASWATAARTARSAPATTSRVCATVNCSATVIRRAAEQVMALGRARRLSRTSTASSPSPTAPAAAWRRRARASTTCSACSGGMRRIRTSARRSSSGSAAR